MRKAEETSALETDVEEEETSKKRRKRVVESDDSEELRRNKGLLSASQEEAGVEETTGYSTQSAAGETVTAASATQVSILTVPAPPKKIKRAQEQPEDKLLHKASELMTTITAKISRQESTVPVPDQPAKQHTRLLRHA